MNKDFHYDCIIVGGGLAGLSLSILLAKQKKHVLLIEKKSYPYHKVCGEYISNESRDFLIRLGLPINDMNLPEIQTLVLSSVKGNSFKQKLDLGGFGISRYNLDHSLFKIAIDLGVTVKVNTTVTQFEKVNEHYRVVSSEGTYFGQLLCASFGKFAFGNFYKSKQASENWVGVKYHIQLNFPNDTIALHNFRGGYCGISKIDQDKYCLCYLVKSSQLRKSGNQIYQLEKEILQQNPYLKEIFAKAKFLYDKPLTISNITFSVKRPVHNHVFYLGDSAGTIAPLSGNGMSNAMRSADLLSKHLLSFLDGQLTFNQVETNYTKDWNNAFQKRIWVGRIIQHLFCKHFLTSSFIQLVKLIKPLRLMIIKQTHGEKF
jgi:flavin-dependent dehydrogenase